MDNDQERLSDTLIILACVLGTMISVMLATYTLEIGLHPILLTGGIGWSYLQGYYDKTRLVMLSLSVISLFGAVCFVAVGVYTAHAIKQTEAANPSASD